MPAARDITVEDLFTHRGGLAYAFTSIGPIAKVMEEKLPAGLSPDRWLAALGGIPLSYQPGERFHYSHSTDVLGFLVARIAGMELRDFLRSRVFGPLQMHDTDFWTPPEKRDRAAVVYRPDAQSGQLQRGAVPRVHARHRRSVRAAAASSPPPTTICASRACC